MLHAALTIAGSDPSGGAGLQADLKTFHRFGVYGMSVVTLLTVQNTCRVSQVEILSPQFVLAQLDAVLEDHPPQAAKTGALGSSAVIEALAERAKEFSFPLVVDPVMISKHGTALLEDSARETLRRRLLPHAFLVTPNIPEAVALSGRQYNGADSLCEMAKAIASFGARSVLIKGGHAQDGGAAAPANDLLWCEGQAHVIPGQRIAATQTHGSGCTHSAAITALLASGVDLLEAATRAKRFITSALRSAPRLGRGIGPLNHWAEL